MAITRAQQARQMLKDGNFVMQGGVRNYLGKQKTVSDVPLKWQSGPDKPSTELAYITKAEKDLLLKKDIHGSLKDGPNKGPEGIISLDSAGDKDGPVGGFSGADVSAAERGERPSGMSQKQADEFRGGAIAAGAGARDSDTAGAKREAEKIQRQVEKRRREARRAITKEEKIEARKTRKRMNDLLKRDRFVRQERLKGILGGKKTFTYTDPITGQVVTKDLNEAGLTDAELADLQALGLDPAFEGPMTPSQQIAFDNLIEKSDKLSGVNLEAFQNRFNLPKTGITSIDLITGLLEGPLKAGAKRNREFFSDSDYMGLFGKKKPSVLEAGKFTYKGLPVDPTVFGRLGTAEMEEIYGDYMDRRMGGEIDAYGNPTLTTDGGDPTRSDPCLGPNPPAYCFVGQQPTTPPATPTRNLGGLSARIGGSLFDFDQFAADGGRIGAMDGGIIDVARQGLFLGGITKGIKKGLKGITRGIKKVAKSPLGKIALAAAAGGYGFGLGPFKGMAGSGFLKGSAVKNFLFKDGVPGLKNLSGRGIASIIGGASLLPFLLGEKEDEFDIEEYYRRNRLADVPLNRRIAGSEFAFAEGGSTEKEPVAKRTMPLLDMGGMEKDYRAEGGFVPIGRMEKADDVPARLSKNEFVFTADAVRNAGDGDVDKGAEVMYNMMKNLESGGEVSEESQGLDGAREMFQTSQRLGEVI